MSTPIPYKKRFFKRRPDNPYESIQVFLPKELVDALREECNAKQLPLSRLLCYALDNELDSRVPFTYATPLPQTVYVKHAYAEEAGRIEKLIATKFSRGVGLDTLMLFRRSIGIPSKDTFMLGIRELIAEDRIEFRADEKRHPLAFQHAPDYEFIFVKEPPARMPRKGVKLVEKLNDQIEALKRENERLKGSK